MSISLRLPSRSAYEGAAEKLTARSTAGAFCILPNHIDSVVALVPCVLILWSSGNDELIYGIDEGILVKHDQHVDICVRRAAQGTDLISLKATVREAFFNIDEQEKTARSALSRLEADMARNFAALKDIR